MADGSFIGYLAIRTEYNNAKLQEPVDEVTKLFDKLNDAVCWCAMCWYHLTPREQKKNVIYLIAATVPDALQADREAAESYALEHGGDVFRVWEAGGRG